MTSFLKKSLWITGIAAAFLIIAAVPAFADNNKNKDHDRDYHDRRAYGHFVAPGISVRGEFDTRWCESLPSGIAKKITPCRDYDNGNNNNGAPIVNSFEVTARSQNSASMVWTTNEPSVGVLFYSTNAKFDTDDTSGVASVASSMNTRHEAQLTNLKADTRYYAIIRSTDADGKSDESRKYSFVTSPGPDTTDPVISNISINTNANNRTATILWKTSEPTASRIRYSSNVTFDWNAGAEVIDNGYSTDHSMTISNLNRGQVYLFQIKSADNAGNDSSSAIGGFYLAQ